MKAPAKSRVRPHTFDVDQDLSRTHNGRTWCGTCGLPGEAGDARHPVDLAPAWPDAPAGAAELDARILGESAGDEESW